MTIDVYLLVWGIRKNAFSFGNGFVVVLMLTSDKRRGRAVVTVSVLNSFRCSKYMAFMQKGNYEG